MAKSDIQYLLKRIEIPYFEGINTSVAHNISKKQEFDFMTNARSNMIGNIEKRQGYIRLGNFMSISNNYGMFYFESTNASSNYFYKVSKVGSTVSVYYLNTGDVWTVLTGGGTGLASRMCSFVSAESCLFIVNGSDVNRYIKEDGTTVVTASDSSGHLYNSPIANKIAYYKDSLYVADYAVGSTNYKNSILRSSNPLGMASLVDGDYAVGSVRIKVTDTKYLRSTDSLDVYRGAIFVQTLTVNSKGEDYIDVTATTAAIMSSDEIWVAGTYTGTRLFRWPENPTTGVNAKQYDTFKLSGGNNDRIKMFTTIGNVLMVANSNNLGIWDNYKWDSYKTENLDVGIGCVSDQGFVKAVGTLWFIHYTGIYATTGGYPKLMSAKVDKYIQGATRAGLEACAAGRKGLSIFFAIGDVTLYRPDGSIDRMVSNVVIEYNMRQENWFIHTGIDAKYFVTFMSDSDPDKLEFCGTSGNVYDFLITTADDGKEYPWELTTSPITLSSSFETICYPKDVILEIERGSGIKCFISLDGGPFYEIKGEAIKGCTVLKVTPQTDNDKYARCRNITISIREFSKRLCKLSRLAITYTETAEFEVFKEQYGE